MFKGLDGAGHIGFIGRAGVFLFVAILFFRLISDESVADPNTTTIGNGLAQLQKSHGGRACLFILGFVLIVYGAFAVCCSLSCAYISAGATADVSWAY